MPILVLLGMYFDALVVIVISQTLLFKLALAILCVYQIFISVNGWIDNKAYLLKKSDMKYFFPIMYHLHKPSDPLSSAHKPGVSPG